MNLEILEGLNPSKIWLWIPVYLGQRQDLKGRIMQVGNKNSSYIVFLNFQTEK